ncbi:MAG: sel1 repeat family protein [Magnetovibrio sp.]|nr:sel1 repeat family protein [Magnetovibrio sp.]
MWYKLGITLCVFIGLMTACVPAPGVQGYFKRGYTAYTKENYTAAFKDFRYLAELNHGQSQYYLAQMYANGEGVPQDVYESSRWHFRAAENGVLESQHTLGMMYQFGSSVARDLSEAASWFTEAANAGYRPSQLKMAEIFSDNSSPAYDPVMAYMWYTIFMEREMGQTRADVLNSRQVLMNAMSSNEIQTGEHLARTWQTPTLPDR